MCVRVGGYFCFSYILISIPAIEMVFLILNGTFCDLGFSFLTQSKKEQNGFHADQFCNGLVFFGNSNKCACKQRDAMEK